MHKIYILFLDFSFSVFIIRKESTRGQTSVSLIDQSSACFMVGLKNTFAK